MSIPVSPLPATPFNFKLTEARKYYEEVSKIIPINMTVDENRPDNTCTFFEPEMKDVRVKYRTAAEERIDMCHELVHVEMFFGNAFSLLWPANPSVDSATQMLGRQIREIVDDTYVFCRLHEKFSILPIHINFFKGCYQDERTDNIHVAPDPENDRVMTVIAAWRIRIAELCLSVFLKKLPVHHAATLKSFLEKFQGKYPKVEALLNDVSKFAAPDLVKDVTKHGKALEALRDHFGVTSEQLMLVRYTKQNGKFVQSQV